MGDGSKLGKSNKISLKKRPARKKNKDSSITVDQIDINEEIQNIKIEEIIAKSGYSKLYGNRKKWENKELHAPNVDFGILDSTYDFKNTETTESLMKTEKFPSKFDNSQTNSTEGTNNQQESIIKSNSSDSKEEILDETQPISKSDKTIEKSEVVETIDTAGMLAMLTKIVKPANDPDSKNHRIHLLKLKL